MKKMLIGLTLCLVALAFIGGSKGEPRSGSATLGELNQLVDTTLANRLASLKP